MPTVAMKRQPKPLQARASVYAQQVQELLAAYNSLLSTIQHTHDIGELRTDADNQEHSTRRRLAELADALYLPANT